MRVSAPAVGIDGRVRSRAVAAGFAVSIAGGWNLANTGPVAEELAAAYGVSLVVIGALTPVLFFWHAATQVPGGRVVDRFGPRTPGLVALGILVVADLAAMIAPNAALGLVARAFAGIGTSLTFVVGTEFVRRFGGSAFTQGVWGGLGVGAGGVALVVVPVALGVFGWRSPFATATIVALAAVPFVLAAPGTPGHLRRPAARARGHAPPSALFRLGLMHAAGLGFAVVIGNWIVPLLTNGDIGPLWLAGLVGSLVLTMGAVGRPLGGWLARRTPEGTHALLAGAMLVGGAATALVALGPPVPVLVVAAAAIGIAGGIPFGPTFYGAGRAFPDASAAASGVINACAGAVIVVGTPLMALAFLLPGEGRTGFLVAAVMWAAIAFFVPPSRAFHMPPAEMRMHA